MRIMGDPPRPRCTLHSCHDQAGRHSKSRAAPLRRLRRARGRFRRACLRFPCLRLQSARGFRSRSFRLRGCGRGSRFWSGGGHGRGRLRLLRCGGFIAVEPLHPPREQRTTGESTPREPFRIGAIGSKRRGFGNGGGRLTRPWWRRPTPAAAASEASQPSGRSSRCQSAAAFSLFSA